MSKYEIRKSTLNEANHGHCNNANNCYYSGKTTCWIIIDTATYQDGGWSEIGLSRKRDAIRMCEWMNASWDGEGAVDMCYSQATGDIDFKEVA